MDYHSQILCAFKGFILFVSKPANCSGLDHIVFAQLIQSNYPQCQIPLLAHAQLGISLSFS